MIRTSRPTTTIKPPRALAAWIICSSLIPPIKRAATANATKARPTFPIKLVTLSIESNPMFVMSINTATTPVNAASIIAAFLISPSFIPPRIFAVAARSKNAIPILAINDEALSACFARLVTAISDATTAVNVANIAPAFCISYSFIVPRIFAVAARSKNAMPILPRMFAAPSMFSPCFVTTIKAATTPANTIKPAAALPRPSQEMPSMIFVATAMRTNDPARDRRTVFNFKAANSLPPLAK